jgi:hypothetical protein
VVELAIITVRSLRLRGESGRELAVGTRSGHFVRLRPGVYAVRTEWDAAAPKERHRALLEACVATAVREPVFSHESAAVLLGIPLVGAVPLVPHTIDCEPAPVTRRTRTGVIAHRLRHPVEPLRVGEFLTTGPIDTAIALASSRPLAAGVAALDHVLALGVDRDTICEIVTLRRPFHGASRALRALDIATGLAESPLESISLVPIALAGLPRPEQQVEVIARGRRYRLDFYWPDARVAGEADGRLKYQTPEDLWQEKVRQDALRSIDISVARWNWAQALAGAPLLERLYEAGLPFAPRFAPRSSRRT